MISFILYEKNSENKIKYENAIYNVLGKNDERIHIYNYKDRDKVPLRRAIYLIGSKNVNKALNIAKEIRENDNWTNPIIIMTSSNSLTKDLLNNSLLILSYIQYGDSLKKDLKKALNNAYRILTKDLKYCFTSNGEIHKIPYYDIVYIEKDNNQNYCIIHTIKDSFTVKDTITNLECSLESVCFMKTHRSCIINIHNIKNYKVSSNEITFINDLKTDLIAREKRQILKDKLSDSKITE